MTAAVLQKRKIGVLGSDGRLALVDGYECDGIGIVPTTVTDETATEEAIKAWLVGEQAGNPPGNVVLSGYVLIHTKSGRAITPKDWLFRSFDQAKACVKALIVANAPLFEGPVRDIALLRGPVLLAHREAGAFTGKYHYLSNLNESIDETAYQEGLAALRANRPTADHIERTARK